MIRPSLLLPATPCKTSVVTVATGGSLPLIGEDADRCCLIISRLPNNTGFIGSTTITYIAPDGFALPQGGFLIWDQWPVYVMHVRDWGPLVGRRWNYFSSSTGPILSVAEYKLDPGNLLRT